MLIRKVFLCLLAASCAAACKQSGSSDFLEVQGASLLPTPRRAIPAMEKLLERLDAKLAALGTGYRDLSRLPPPAPQDDRTQAPYFHVPGKTGVEELPLKETRADAKVAGVIARVRVRQVYENSGKSPIEAIYVFPASTRAAVHGMRMKIGKRTIEAKIQERALARKTYEAAKEAGKRTSLLEQERPNVFTMNVANILPGDRIEVELDYSELLVPKDGVYELVYPTVVGPRYGGGASPSDKWISNPYLKEGEKEPYRFGFAAHVESPIGIAELTSPSHKIDVKYASKSSADVTLAEKGGGNRDVVLRYKLAGGKIETGALLFETPTDKYFLLMMEPPARVRPKEIPRREYLFVLDVSGSMYGFPLETAKHLMRRLLSSLSPRDYFNVVLFSGAAAVLYPKSLPATEENVGQAITHVERQRGGGGTELMGALRMTYEIPPVAERGVSRTVVVVTDGYVGVEAQTFRFVRKNLDKANLFAFGIGSSVNRSLIEGMARAGLGQPFVVLKPAEAHARADELKTYIESPVLTQVKLDFEGLDVLDVAPQKVPDLMAQRPLVIFGRYRGKAVGKIRIRGETGAGKFEKVIPIEAALANLANEPVRILWARKWVEALMDQHAMLPGHKEIRDAVVDVGLSHQLLTQFTSFVAVDSEIAREGKPLTTVNQPLPLPQGVSNYAVGGSAAVFGSRSFGAMKMRRARADRLSRSPYAPPPAAMPAPVESVVPGVAPRGEEKTEAQDQAKPQEPRAHRGRLAIVSAENARPDRLGLIAERLSRAFAGCLLRSGATGTFTVTFEADGRVRVSGAGGALATCLEAVAERIARSRRALAALRMDAAKALTLTLRVRP
jgi:Ca-activated chloride channel family protein